MSSPHAAHRRTVHEGVHRRKRYGVPNLERSAHARRALRLGTYDPDLRSFRSEPQGDARDQSTTADGNDDGIDVAALGGQVHGDRSLPGDRPWVVERMDIDRSSPCAVLQRCSAALVEGSPSNDRLDPPAAHCDDALTLLAWRGARQEDATVDLERSTAIGKAQAMIACARANHARSALGLGERGDEVVRAADLVGAADLQVFTLEEHGHPERLGEPLAALDGGHLHDGSQDVRRSGNGRAAQLVGGHRSPVVGA